MEPKKSESDNGKKYKIFIIEDDKFLLNIYTIKFSSLGHEVTSASNGLEALTKIKDGYTPDIMICDIEMPRMDGLQFIEKIKKEKLAPDAVIIMLTNRSDKAEMTKSLNLGAAGYLIKATKIPSEVVSDVLEIAAEHQK